VSNNSKYIITTLSDSLQQRNRPGGNSGSAAGVMPLGLAQPGVMSLRETNMPYIAGAQGSLDLFNWQVISSSGESGGGGVTAREYLNHWYKFPSPGEASFPPGGVNTIIDVGTSTAARDNIDATNIGGQEDGRTLGSDTFDVYDFNGINANATSVVGYNSTLFPADDFSFTAWVKWDTVANFEMIFMAGDVGAQDFSEGYYLYPILTSPASEANGYAPGQATPNNVLAFSSGGYNASSGGSLVYASIPSTGTWFHVACTIDVSEGSQAIYINGTAGTGPGVTVQAPTSTDENRFLSIGAYQINGGSQFYKLDGEMSDVRFYGKALSASEVGAIYAGDFSP